MTYIFMYIISYCFK